MRSPLRKVVGRIVLRGFERRQVGARLDGDEAVCTGRYCELYGSAVDASPDSDVRRAPREERRSSIEANLLAGESTLDTNLPRELNTERLRLRRWCAADQEPFAALNSDPRVMEHFPAVLTRSESDTLIERIESHFDRHGFGLWAVELRDVAPLVGFVGLFVPRFETEFTPCVEIGWRLDAQYWGQGIVTEGARATLKFGFETLGLEEIVSFTVPGNLRSRRVMERIGMNPRRRCRFRTPRDCLRAIGSAPTCSTRSPDPNFFNRLPAGSVEHLCAPDRRR